jgi:hypothetical protein
MSIAMGDLSNDTPFERYWRLADLSVEETNPRILARALQIPIAPARARFLDMVKYVRNAKSRAAPDEVVSIRFDHFGLLRTSGAMTPNTYSAFIRGLRLQSDQDGIPYPASLKRVPHKILAAIDWDDKTLRISSDVRRALQIIYDTLEITNASLAAPVAPPVDHAQELKNLQARASKSLQTVFRDAAIKDLMRGTSSAAIRTAARAELRGAGMTTGEIQKVLPSPERVAPSPGRKKRPLDPAQG